MAEENLVNEQCPYHRVPSPWIVFVGTLSLFAGLNLFVLYDTWGAYRMDGVEEVGAWPRAPWPPPRKEAAH